MSTGPAAGPPAPETAIGEPTGAPTGQVARKALFWSALNNVLGRAGTLLTGVVLARILAPADYGIYAVALIALTAVLSMNELGVSVAIVRWPGDVGRIAPTVVTLALTSSVILWIGCFLAAPTICAALHAPEATGVLRVLTLSVLIDAVTAVPAALMTRDFMQRQRLVVDTLGFLVGSGSAICLALAGFGAWSLAISLLAGNVVNAVFILRFAPALYRPGFDRGCARELLGFGLPLAASSLLIFALLNVDYIVVGRALGPVELGLYLLAFNLSAWPVSMFSAPVRRVSLPAFARLHAGDGDPAAAFAWACTALLALTLPTCLLLSIFAEPLIALVYGETWARSAAVLPWLMLLATARVLGELTYDYLVALGRARPNFVIQLLWLVALVPALVIGVDLGGIVGVGVAHAVVALVVVLPAYAVAIHRTGVQLPRIARQLRRPVIALILSAVVGIIARQSFSDPVLQVLVGGSLAAGCYVAVSYPLRSMLRAGIPTAAGP